MKLLTVNFLTCAVKSCKSALSITTQPVATEDSSRPFPLHFRDAILERIDIPYNPAFLRNILPRVNWEALQTTATELGLLELLPKRNPADHENEASAGQDDVARPDTGATDGVGTAMEVEGSGGVEGGARKPSQAGEETEEEKDKILRQLHILLLETSVSEGKLVCGKCGFEYAIKDGVGNFLLPPHLV